MWDLAVREEDFEAVDAMLGRYRGRPPLSLRLLPALARRDTAAVAALLEEGRGLESRQLQIGARYAASYLGNPAVADSLAALDVGWRERPANRLGAQLLRGGLAAAAGRWSAAREAFRLAETMDGADQPLVHRAMAAVLPLLPVPAPDLQALRRELERWAPAAASTGPSAGLRPALRLYLIGLLASRLGATADAERAARQLDALPAPPDLAPVARAMAATVRADLAWRDNRPADALAALDAAPFRAPLDLIALSRAAHLREYGLEHARYLRAAALAATGRDAEALGWYRYGLRGAPQEYQYHGPVHFQLGSLFERMGQPDSAVAHLERFLRLWAHADSGAGEVTAAARATLARLGRNVHP